MMKPRTRDYIAGLTSLDAFREIERNRWAVSPQCGGGWVIDDADWTPGGDDGDVIEIARTRGSLLDAVKMAIRNRDTGEVLARK